MEFRILGPLEVVRDGQPLRLGGSRDRSILAMLVLDAGRVVPVGSLVDRLWPQDPPKSAVHAVHVSVSRLRRVLTGDGPARIETHRPGYLLRVAAGEVDLQEFEALCERGRACAEAGDPASASAAFAQAVRLWRGPVPADLPGEAFAGSVAARLAGALAMLQDTRLLPAEELGIEPGPELPQLPAGVAQGRAAYQRRAWLDAFTSLSAADLTDPLSAADLELLATSACLIGRDDDAVRTLERAYATCLDTGQACAAARCAIWTGLVLANIGEHARANGWFGRAGRLLDREGRDCVERGYRLVPEVLGLLDATGDLEAAVSAAAEVGRIGERFGDADLVAFAGLTQGRARIKQGRVGPGMALLDEAMVAVVAGELSSPILTGLIYCSVIDACQEVFDVRRTREWTGELARWCEAQPQLVDFTGLCLVHRAECLQQHGAWPDALDEARRAGERFAPGVSAAGAGHYRQAEIHRLRGDGAVAEDAYRQASARGWPPQPGLALLWLAQGRTDAAAAAICRVLGETVDPLARARLLPACVEITLAAGDSGRARSACHELAEIAASYRWGALTAMVAQARGRVELAEGQPTAALIALREACQLWQDVDAPYEVAQVRALLGLACRRLGDHESAGWELWEAREGFARLGAAPDLDRVRALIAAPGARPAGLTPRELQVLRLVAAGKPNRAIAVELVLSERTVDRHVSSILTKLGVPSRTAATAYAYAHHLV